MNVMPHRDNRHTQNIQIKVTGEKLKVSFILQKKGNRLFGQTNIIATLLFELIP